MDVELKRRYEQSERCQLFNDETKDGDTLHAIRVDPRITKLDRKPK